MAVHAVLSHPVSRGNSLLTGKIQGKTAKYAGFCALHVETAKENSGLRANSLHALTGNFGSNISEIN